MGGIVWAKLQLGSPECGWLCAVIPGSLGSIFDQGTKILHATWHGQKKKKRYVFHYHTELLHIW